jgi:hypothetical protein
MNAFSSQAAILVKSFQLSTEKPLKLAEIARWML